MLRAPFTLYGLSSAFTGSRWVAQHDALPSHVVLGHGEPRAHWVRVGVMLRTPSPPCGSIDIVDTLAGTHAAAEGLHLTLEQTHASRWFDATFSLDGVPERFRMIGDEPHWLAYRENEDTWLFVHSRGFPPAFIELVHVDPRDYLSDG